MRFLSLILGLLLLTGCKPDKPMPDNENAVTAFALQHFVDNDVITGAVTAPVITSPSTKCCSANAVTAFSLSGIGLSGLQPVRRRRPRIRLKKRMRD